MPAGPAPRMYGPFTIPLDGIRCIAVTIVFLGHGANLGGPSPGDVGVTVFLFLNGDLSGIFPSTMDWSGSLATVVQVTNYGKVRARPPPRKRAHRPTAGSRAFCGRSRSRYPPRHSLHAWRGG